MTTKPQRACPLFISYSRRERSDQKLINDFLTHLKRLEQDGLITIWKDTNIQGGDNWQDRIDAQLGMAEVILLLVTPTYLVSPQCNREMDAAWERHLKGQALVIPVLLKEAVWQRLKISNLQVFPRNGKSISELKRRDAGFVDVVSGIRTAIEKWISTPHEDVPPPPPPRDVNPVIVTDSQDTSQMMGGAVGPPSASLDGPEFRYRNLFKIGPLTIPYIVLLNSLSPGIHEYTYGELDRPVLRTERWNKLPADFDKFKIQSSIYPVTKWRFESFEPYTLGARSFRLRLQFSEVTYGDYMKSGPYLDELVPGSNETFRDRYAPDTIPRHDFSRSELTNITGVGVFLITRDNQIIIPRHSRNLYVYPNVLSYSASGTLDWRTDVHPFDGIIRECYEELGYRLSIDNLHLFSVGIDAKFQYFQFSFYADIPHSSAEILDGVSQAADSYFEFEDVVSYPFEVGAIVSLAKKETWDPTALAAVLTLTSKRLGEENVLRAIDEAWLRKQSHDIMATEWKRRASLPGDFAVSSSRYPQDELPEKSRGYVDAVMAFIGDDIATKDVVEFGAGIGRITQRLVKQVSRLTCVDLSEEMLKRNRELLGPASQDVAYHIGFVQDYQPSVKHDVAVASLVLIHQVSALMFTEAVDALMRSADTIFLFEHCDPAAHTSVNTKARSADELIQAFHGYNVERRSEYFLFSDRLVFLKLVRSVGPEGELTHQQR